MNQKLTSGAGKETIIIGSIEGRLNQQGENIQSKIHKRFVITTDSRKTKKPAKNILGRTFTADKANQKWVSDVKFIPTRKGWLFLAAIMDLYSRMIVGWSMGEKNSTELVEDALKMAAAHRKDIQGVLLHSDQGAQYAATSLNLPQINGRLKMHTNEYTIQIEGV